MPTTPSPPPFPLSSQPLPSDDNRLERLDPKGCPPLGRKSHPSYRMLHSQPFSMAAGQRRVVLCAVVVGWLLLLLVAFVVGWLLSLVLLLAGCFCCWLVAVVGFVVGWLVLLLVGCCCWFCCWLVVVVGWLVAVVGFVVGWLLLVVVGCCCWFCCWLVVVVGWLVAVVGFVVGWLLLVVVGCCCCWLVAERPSTMLVYFRDGSAQTIQFLSYLILSYLILSYLILSYLSRSLADRWGTTVDITTSFLHSLRFSAFRSGIFHSRPVHSLMLSFPSFPLSAFLSPSLNCSL